VLFLEHKASYRSVSGPVPAGEHVEELGKARVVRPGDAVTILGWGRMLHEALAAAEELADRGVETEVIDLRTLLPLDRETVIASVMRTGRLCVVHEDTRTMGFGAELAAIAAETCLDALRAPPVRVTMPDIGGIPVADAMEDAALPDRSRIVAAVLELLERPGGRRAKLEFDPAIPEAVSVIEVAMPREHLDRVLAAVESACAAFPDLNAEFSWDGVRRHQQVRFDLELGARAPAAGGGTFVTRHPGWT
jgi:hypothetical protein